MTKVEGIPAYPLAWPEGWPRTPPSSYRGHSSYKVHSDKARRELFDDLRRMGASVIVVSSYVPVRQDGTPYADAARRVIRDPGVAVYFTIKGKQHVMARDIYAKPEDNLRMIGLAVRALRDLERNGGSYMMERAFTGFLALPAPAGSARPWADVLGFIDTELSIGLTEADIQAAYRRKLTTAHPQYGGTDAALSELNAARDEALKVAQV